MNFINLARNTFDNYNEMRGRTSSPNKLAFGDSSMSSTVLSVIYHKRMEMNNKIEIDIELRDCSQLLYTILVRQVNQISMVVNPNNNMLDQCVLIEGPVLNTFSITSPLCVDEDNIINIQLPYDPNRPMEPKLWDGNFHPISLYRSLEHLASDAENIKKSLAYIATYIKNKKIEMTKSNDIKDFEGIGKATWELISFIYESGWDSLVADNHKNSFRQKVSYKFTLKVISEKNGKKKENIVNKPASIDKLPSPIPAKSPKEVNKISKYFKPKKLFTQTIPILAKSYAQSARNVSNTEEVLRIKEAFLSLQATNINNI